jgi:hypothetical protein
MMIFMRHRPGGSAPAFAVRGRSGVSRDLSDKLEDEIAVIDAGLEKLTAANRGGLTLCASNWP